MQLLRLLHNTFQKELPQVHKVRLNNLMLASETLIHHNRLSVTALGRNIPVKAQERSNIRKMDRLAGNKYIEKEAVKFYQVMNSYLLPSTGEVWIHIDWSCLNSTTNQYLLRASLTMKGRSIVIYEEPHGKKGENNHSVHKAFLNQLKAILPEGIQPVIVTDAGFRAPWFAYIRSLGWDFVGRLRNKNAVLLEGSKEWHLSHQYFEKATNKPAYLAHAQLTKKQRVPVEIVLYKGTPKNRKKLNKNGKPSRSGDSKKYAQLNSEPWVLVTSIQSAKKKPCIAVNIYKQRMRIEENFRDTKCIRYGLGLDDSISQSPKRFRALLLIAAIATFAAWLAGLFTTFKGEAHKFQAHSASFKNVLSVVFLGKRALKKGFRIGIRQFQFTLNLIANINRIAQAESGL